MSVNVLKSIPKRRSHYREGDKRIARTGRHIAIASNKPGHYIITGAGMAFLLRLERKFPEAIEGLPPAGLQVAANPALL